MDRSPQLRNYCNALGWCIALSDSCFSTVHIVEILRSYCFAEPTTRTPRSFCSMISRFNSRHHFFLFSPFSFKHTFLRSMVRISNNSLPPTKNGSTTRDMLEQNKTKQNWAADAPTSGGYWKLVTRFYTQLKSKKIGRVTARNSENSQLEALVSQGYCCTHFTQWQKKKKSIWMHVFIENEGTTISCQSSKLYERYWRKIPRKLHRRNSMQGSCKLHYRNRVCKVDLYNTKHMPVRLTLPRGMFLP